MCVGDIRMLVEHFSRTRVIRLPDQYGKWQDHIFNVRNVLIDDYLVQRSVLLFDLRAFFLRRIVPFPCLCRIFSILRISIYEVGGNYTRGNGDVRERRHRTHLRYRKGADSSAQMRRR